MHDNKDKEGWRLFLKLCSKLKSPEDLNAFFSLFLTLEEHENLASRVLIIKALVKGKLTQREIARDYKTSIAQITRGSNSLKIIDNKLRTFLEEEFKKIHHD